MKCKAMLFTVVLIILMATPALAKWSGVVIVDKEYSPGQEIKTIYTLTLDYSIRDWWYLDLVLDHHPLKGTDADISTTFYAPDVFPNTIYVTAGVRRGVWRSDTPATVYGRLAFRF